VLFRNGGDSQSHETSEVPKADPLAQKAYEIVPALVEAMRIFGEDFVKECGTEAKFDGKRSEADLLAEILFFVVHLLDRLVLVALGPFKRKVFMDAVLTDLSQAAEPMGLTVGVFQDRWNKSQRQYARWKLTSDEGESYRGWLFWEFGKKLASRYGVGNPAAIVWVTSRAVDVMEGLNEAVKYLEIEKLR
jgi:hypothetical protein